MTHRYATVVEHTPVTLECSGPNDDTQQSIRIFTLSLNGVSVEVTSLGASISRWMVPPHLPGQSEEDIVLGFESPLDSWKSNNPSYFGVVVGRVANRIANGQFCINKTQYSLDTNNPPNHLHGGPKGFSTQLWDASIVSCGSSDAENISTDECNSQGNGVEFVLLSQDGDQGYPGTIRVTATYFLKNLNNNSMMQNASAVSLCLQMKAELLPLSTKAGDTCQTYLSTPVNLTQHSYFNLSRHDDPRGVLDHKLTLNCDAYTPIDETGIPTRHIASVADDSVMDFRKGRLMCDALQEYIAKNGKSNKEEYQQGNCSRNGDYLAWQRAMNSYCGFDHNYVVGGQSVLSEQVCHVSSTALPVVGVLEHSGKRRKLTVRSDAPGVQLYTGNYLDGSLTCKNGTKYEKFQGLCLETQHFPDSILEEEDIKQYPDFAKGKCVILGPEQPTYIHNVEYELSCAIACDASIEYGSMEEKEEKTKDPSDSIFIEVGEFKEKFPAMANSKVDFDPKSPFRGIDSHGVYVYASPDEMWRNQGVHNNATTRSSWYDRAAEYYEENCPATLDGVMGGFASISDLDLQGSREFINSVIHCPGRKGRLLLSAGAACECGAGIGRVTKGLLLPLGVTRCDLVESSSRLLSVAPDYIGDESHRCRFYCSGLQDWNPVESVYSIIWIQWVLCYLTDVDAIDFLRRCGKALIEYGCICIKENTCTTEDFVLDEQDASVTRSVPYLKHLAAQAGLRLVLEHKQSNFPDNIFPVPMLAFEVLNCK